MESRDEAIIEFYLSPRTQKETVEKFGLSNRYQLRKILEKHNIEERPKEISNKIRLDSIEKTNLEKYGVKYNFESSDPKLNGKTTRLQKYGVTSMLQLPEYVDKMKNTKNKKYNSPNYNNKEKMIATSTERYGGIGFEVKELKNKSENTCLIKYGKRNYMQSSDFRNNFDIYANKRYQTMKLNNSFRVSKPEDIFYSKLIEKFDKKYIHREYKSSVYPFKCDFYIESIDTYIELNITWTHGEHEFNASDPRDLLKLNMWKEKSKTSKYYMKAIETWQIYDPLKIKTARENKLNYLAFYNKEEALNWLSRLKGDEKFEPDK